MKPNEAQKNMHVETWYHPPRQNGRSCPQGPLRVAAYARVSTLTENQEDSFETQCAYYEKMIASDPHMRLVGVYGDQGVSGLSAKGRTEFARMLRDCKDGKIDLVMTRSVSRLSRNMAECVETVNALKALGIPVRFEKEGLTTTDPGSELFFHVLAVLAQEESGSLSRRLTWAVDRRAAMGDPIRKCAYGYRKATPPSRAWQIQREEARLVRTAFEMAAARCPYQEIRARLDQMEKAAGTHAVWSQQRLHRLLRNETYRGDIHTHKTYCLDYVTKLRRTNHGEREAYYISDHHEPVVSAALFDQVQSLMDAHMLHSGAYHKRQRFIRDKEDAI